LGKERIVGRRAVRAPLRSERGLVHGKKKIVTTTEREDILSWQLTGREEGLELHPTEK